MKYSILDIMFFASVGRTRSRSARRGRSRSRSREARRLEKEREMEDGFGFRVQGQRCSAGAGGLGTAGGMPACLLLGTSCRKSVGRRKRRQSRAAVQVTVVSRVSYVFGQERRRQIEDATRGDRTASQLQDVRIHRECLPVFTPAALCSHAPPRG